MIKDIFKLNIVYNFFYFHFVIYIYQAELFVAKIIWIAIICGWLDVHSHVSNNFCLCIYLCSSDHTNRFLYSYNYSEKSLLIQGFKLYHIDQNSS